MPRSVRHRVDELELRIYRNNKTSRMVAIVAGQRQGWDVDARWEIPPASGWFSIADRARNGDEHDAGVLIRTMADEAIKEARG